jgi:hypothetical protein
VEGQFLLFWMEHILWGGRGVQYFVVLLWQWRDVCITCQQIR